MLASYQLAYILESSAGLVIYDSLLAEESARLCMRFGCCLYMNITHTRHSERTDLADSCSRSLTCRSCARHRRPSLQSAPAPCASEASERSPPPTDPEPPSRAARSIQPLQALAAPSDAPRNQHDTRVTNAGGGGGEREKEARTVTSGGDTMRNLWQNGGDLCWRMGKARVCGYM